jgi:hypothetical protein
VSVLLDTSFGLLAFKRNGICRADFDNSRLLRVNDEKKFDFGDPIFVAKVETLTIEGN